MTKKDLSGCFERGARNLLGAPTILPVLAELPRLRFSRTGLLREVGASIWERDQSRDASFKDGHQIIKLYKLIQSRK